MGEDSSRHLVESIRQQCLKKGLSGIKGLSVLFRGMDRDYSKKICLQEFQEGMRRYGIQISEQDCVTVFSLFDNDHSGSVDFHEFLVQLRPSMTKSRIDVVNEAFDKLDVIKDDILQVDDLKIVYKSHAQKHPKFLSGEWTLDQVLQSFLDTFDSPGDKDGMVTREEFMNYYAGVSATVEDDSYFDLMMRSVWGLPPKGQKNKPGSQRKV